MRRFVLIWLIFPFISYAQDIEYARSVVQKLASPELKGRGYIDHGDKLAAQFISDEYKSIGLKTLSKGYLQRFKISANTLPVTKVKINNEALIPGVDYLVESTSPSLKGNFAILKITRKDLDTENKLMEVINKADNKFILIDNTSKEGENKEASERIKNSISLLKYYTKISCKGIIIYTKDKLTWESSDFRNVRPVITVGKTLDLDKTDYIEVNIESKFLRRYKTQNVAAYIQGSVKPDSFIVITAHYDHLGKMGNEIYFPGANDNASGVAMLLNLAKHYATKPPAYSILFVCFSGEELGIKGSEYFVHHPLIDLKKISFLLNFDLAGTGEEGIKVVNGTVFKDKFNLLTEINSENNLLPKVEIRGEACISDHCYFYKAGVPCFYIYTQGGIKAYHDIYDKAETLPLTEFVDYCTLMIKFIDALEKPD